VNSLQDLLYVSIVCGFAFGCVSTITLILVGKLYGQRNFALNWGCMAVMPAFGGPFFSYIFGAIFDKHSENQVCKGIDCCLYKGQYVSSNLMKLRDFFVRLVFCLHYICGT
jgi:hypothetical protein